MIETTTCEITVEPERDSENLIVWRCTCGIWGTDYDEDDLQDSIDMHLDGIEDPR